MLDNPAEHDAMTCRTCGGGREDRQDWATRCDRCLRRDGRGLWAVVALLSVLIGFVLTIGDLGSWPLVSLGCAVGLVLGYPLHVLVHEVGHAIAGRFAGMRLTRLVIGNGPPLASTQLRGTLFAVHRYQGIGSTWVDTIDRGRFKSQWTTFYLGGPLFSAVVAVISLLLAGDTAVGAGFLAFGLLNAFMAIVTLRPTRGLGGAASSDLADLRDRRAMSDDDIAAEIAYTTSQQVEEAQRRGQADLAMHHAQRYVRDFPESESRAWFDQVIADGPS